jgi:chemotaxis protein MotB
MDQQNPNNPINRRISIIVMNKKAEETAARDGGTVTISEEKQAEPTLQGIGTPAAGAEAPAAHAAPAPLPAAAPSMPPNAATVAQQATAAAAAVVAKQDAAAVKH